MKPVLEYKGYYGSAEVSTEDDVLFGRLLYIGDVVSFTAQTPKALEAAFRDAVDDYLESCRECGDEPDVPFKGVFNVRLGHDLHRACALSAERSGVKLNEWVRNACQSKLEGESRGATTTSVINMVLQAPRTVSDFELMSEFESMSASSTARYATRSVSGLQ